MEVWYSDLQSGLPQEEKAIKLNKMTQETMTKEQILEILNNVYRNHMTPGIATGIIHKQLSAERERYDELKAKYDSLVMDNMTHEYNAAEAERHLPDLIKQYVDRELERAGKLVEVVEKLSKMGPNWNLFGLVDEAKQTLKEYNENH